MNFRQGINDFFLVFFFIFAEVNFLGPFAQQRHIRHLESMDPCALRALISQQMPNTFSYIFFHLNILIRFFFLEYEISLENSGERFFFLPSYLSFSFMPYSVLGFVFGCCKRPSDMAKNEWMFLLLCFRRTRYRSLSVDAEYWSTVVSQVFKQII